MTMGRGADANHAASGPDRHIPVLRDAVMAALAVTPNSLHLDGTFGAGGYSRALLGAGARVIALDRDPAAIARGLSLVAQASGGLTLLHAKFSALEAVLAGLGLQGAVLDGLTLDIGVSSMQIDEGARGFSFRHDGPLDMRMDGPGIRDGSRSAADIVNGASHDEIADILFYYGEERASRRIARAIVHDRETRPFTSTLALAEMIARVCPGKPHEIHPATRTFQALRIAVNDELGELVAALQAAERVLKPGGRLVVVSFHSLEDRIVKQFFASRSNRGQARSRRLPGEPEVLPETFSQPGKQPIVPDQAEMRDNPRARSAKLRFGVRLATPFRPMDAGLSVLASLPAPDAKGR